MTYNFDKLRKDLKDECYAAMFNGFPMAVMDLKDIDKATNEQLLRYAKEFGLNLNKYIIK